jgi:hypothetical protein
MHLRGRRGGSGLTVGYGASPTVTGVLLDAAAKPIAGAPIVLGLEGVQPGTFTFRNQVLTDAAGHFTLTLPIYHSAQVRVAYVPAATAPALVALKAFRLTVRAGLTLRAAPHRLRNGRAVTFSGRVLGGPIPDAGALVQIQGLNGHHWQEIGTARATSAAGRYRLRFVFRSVRRFTRFEFRAKVLREPLYPYATGFSSVRSVLVRP